MIINRKGALKAPFLFYIVYNIQQLFLNARTSATCYSENTLFSSPAPSYFASFLSRTPTDIRNIPKKSA